MHAAPRHTRNRPVVAIGLVVAVLAAGAFFIVNGLDPTPNQAVAGRLPTLIATSESQTSTAPVESPAPSLTAALQSVLTKRPVVATAPATLLGPTPEPFVDAGPGLTEPGILLIASPAPDGSFDVSERIRLLIPVSVLTLRPAPVGLAGQQFAASTAAATEVQVSAGGQPVAVPGSEVDAAVDLPVAAADQFELRYRLTDVTVRSTPSPAGRALAAIGPLTGAVDDDLPVLFVLSGGAVLGLNCPLLPLSQQSCGRRGQTGPSMQRELPWQLALASVQLNLPPV